MDMRNFFVGDLGHDTGIVAEYGSNQSDRLGVGLGDRIDDIFRVSSETNS